MFARLLLGGVAWLTAFGLFAVLLDRSGSPPSTLDSSRDGVTALARSLNQSRPASRRGEYSWTVTRATAALGSLVVEVDVIHPDDARNITEQLLAGHTAQYDEVLVYVRSPDRVRDPVVRRIEWTPRRGYLASTF